MSNNVNTNIMERAAEVLEEVTGTIWEGIIQRDIDANDLEALAYHVREAEAELALQYDWAKEDDRRASEQDED